MAHRTKRRPPIDRRFLRKFVDSMEHVGGACVVSRASIDQWATEHLDGKRRAQREKAIGGPWLVFLTEQITRATLRMAVMHSAENPGRN